MEGLGTLAGGGRISKVCLESFRSQGTDSPFFSPDLFFVLFYFVCLFFIFTVLFVVLFTSYKMWSFGLSQVASLGLPRHDSLNN